MANLNIQDKKLFEFNCTIDNLAKYAKLVSEQNKVMNISGFKTLEDVFNLGVINSLYMLCSLKNIGFDLTNKNVLDIGAGAGFPSIPILLASKQKFNLTIIESQKKRVDFLNKLKEEFNLNTLKIIWNRAEEYKEELNSFDLITARAVSSLKNLYMMSNHLLKKNGIFYFPKGKNYQDEADELLKSFNYLANDLSIESIETLNNKEKEYYVKIIKKNDTPSSWPLSWKKIESYK